MDEVFYSFQSNSWVFLGNETENTNRRKKLFAICHAFLECRRRINWPKEIVYILLDPWIDQIMLFTSNLRKAVDQYRTPGSTHGSPAKLTLEEKRAQLLRRHTCATIGTLNSVQATDSKLPLHSCLIPSNGLASSGRQVSFREPFVEEQEEDDKVVFYF